MRLASTASSARLPAAVVQPDATPGPRLAGAVRGPGVVEHRSIMRTDTATVDAATADRLCSHTMVTPTTKPTTARNVLGTELKSCSTKPMTGFFRDGCCNTTNEDLGAHTVCVDLTAEFLQFSKDAGNDLSTPRPELAFPRD